MSVVPVSAPPPRAAWRRAVFYAAAALYALAGSAALVWLTPRVPYADEWRQFTRLLGEPFGRGVLGVDNGHAEMLPNVLRWADLRLAGGHELLIVAGTLVCLLATCALLLRAVRRDTTLDATQRAGAAFVLAFGLFWLGSVHALAVLEDAPHVWLIWLLLAAAALRATAPAPKHGGDLAAIGAAAVLAVLTFGSGWAIFPALALAFALRRERAQSWAALAAAALLALLIYLCLPGAAHAPEAGFAPLTVALRVLQLLGAPFVYLFWPLLDPAAAAAVPEPLRGLALACAQAWTAHVGDVRTSVMPQALVGAVFCVLFAAACRRAWRTPAGSTQQLGLVLAAFGLACAVLIALARTAYFAEHADQIYALRYVPWSALGWCGLLLAALARCARFAPALALALVFVALPSEMGLAVLARHQREVAEDTALGVAVGVIPAEQALGENPLDDLRAAREPLRLAQTSVFAWPETQALQRDVPAAALEVAAPDLVLRETPNQFGASARAVEAGNIAAPGCAQRLLLVREGSGVGLLRRGSDGRWRGVAVGAAADGLLVFAVCN